VTSIKGRRQKRATTNQSAIKEKVIEQKKKESKLSKIKRK